MAKISLSSAVDEDLFKVFQNIASKSSSSSNPAAALKGQSSEVSISTALRQGARTYSTAVTGINTVFSFLNVTESKLGEIEKIVDQMMTIAERATQSSIGQESRSNLDSEFRRLIRTFEDFRDASELGDRNYLKRDDIKELFVVIGLDPERSSSIADLMDEFSAPPGDEDSFLASEYTKGARPVPVPPSYYGTGSTETKVDPDVIFDSSRSIRTRPDAYRMFYDLQALKRQISENKNALAESRTYLGKNLDLVRETGLAMLKVSDEITGAETAGQVADRVRALIQRNAGAALAQAENLEPLAVAALTLSNDSFTKK